MRGPLGYSASPMCLGPINNNNTHNLDNHSNKMKEKLLLQYIYLKFPIIMKNDGEEETEDTVVSEALEEQNPRKIMQMLAHILIEMLLLYLF